MTTAAAAPGRRPSSRRYGRSTPSIAPPAPLKSLLREYEADAKKLGLRLMPWQKVAGRYLMAVDERGRFRFREVAVVVSRQNGKTTLLLPRIRFGLRHGRRMLHTAQNRQLPRETFVEVARALIGDPMITEIRHANGQETIRSVHGGEYSLVAPRPSARGIPGVDDVFIDEVREQRSFDLIGAIKPTLTARANSQLVYMSNAGDEDSVVLNDLKRRAESSSSLAYLEYSADAELTIDDVEGWYQANPALGHTIELETLRDNFSSMPAHVFETEHLCRWVVSMRPKVVNVAQFDGCLAPGGELERMHRPASGLSLDATGTRAAAALSWRQSDGTIALTELAAVSGTPIDVDRLGRELFNRSLRSGVVTTGFDDLTDRKLAAYLGKRSRPVTGREWANACANFAQLVESGRLRHDGAPNVAADLQWSARHDVGQGAWSVVKAKDERPIPSLLAAIRAVWLASSPSYSARRPQIR